MLSHFIGMQHFTLFRYLRLRFSLIAVAAKPPRHVDCRQHAAIWCFTFIVAFQPIDEYDNRLSADDATVWYHFPFTTRHATLKQLESSITCFFIVYGQDALYWCCFPTSSRVSLYDAWRAYTRHSLDKSYLRVSLRLGFQSADFDAILLHYLKMILICFRSSRIWPHLRHIAFIIAALWYFTRIWYGYATLSFNYPIAAYF